MEPEKKSWTALLFAYAQGEKRKLVLSVILSVLSVAIGLAPFYCMYALVCRFAAGTADSASAVLWCLLALGAYLIKILLFSLSTGISHSMATIQNADQIPVVDDGRIAQAGTHQELIAREGIYQSFTRIRQKAEAWQIQEARS